MGAPFLTGLYSAVFASTAIYFAWRGVRARGFAVEFTEHVLHVAMSVVMVAMVWPWWDRLPRGFLAAFFVAATGWFLTMLVLQAAGIAAAGRHGRRGLWYRSLHAVMTAAMAWMVAVTPHHRHHDHGLSSAAQTTGVALVTLMLVLGLIEAVVFLRHTADLPIPSRSTELSRAYSPAGRIYEHNITRYDSIDDESINADPYRTRRPMMPAAHPDSMAPEHAAAESVGVLAMMLGMVAMCAALL